MNKKFITSLIIGIALSGVALYFAFINVPFTDLIAYLGSIDYIWVLPTVLIVILCFILRAVRWQLILSLSQKVGFRQAYHPMMIGFMINCVLPGRIGEVARPVILQRKEKIPFSTGLATVVAERVFDLSILIILFTAMLATIKIDPDLTVEYSNYHLNRQTLEAVFSGMLKLSVILFAGILLVSFNTTRMIIIRIIIRIPSFFFFLGTSVKDKIKEKVCTPVANIVENFASGFSLVKSPKMICICFIFSVIIWTLHAFTYYVFAIGCPGVNLSFAELTVVMIIVCFVIGLPSVPGFWGLWEAGGVFAMLLFGVSSKEAAGFTLANHAVQMFPVILLGIISAFLTGVDIRKVGYEKSKRT